MDYGNTGQGGLNLFDPEMAVEMSSLQTPLQTLPRMNVDWDGGFAELTNLPAGPPGGVYPAPTAIPYPHVGGDIGFGGLCAPGPGAFDALAGTIGGGGSSSSSSSNIGVKPEGMLAIAHNSTRAARNGREQQRAQKISDVIDKLKGMLDKAKFTTGDASSKLHVLVRCESYIRNLQDRTRCHEMEAKLRSAASGNQYSADPNTTSSGSRRAGARGTRSSNDMEWTKKSDRARRSNASQRGETDGCTSSSGADGGSSSRSSSSSSGSSDGDCTKKVDAFFDEESSSSAAEGSRAFGRGVATRSARRAAADSAGSASSSVEEDGDTGSSGDSSGGDTLAGTTTDSRGFTTDSSFSGDSGSADSGDTGSGDTRSGDGGSESEEGAASARMRVVNYFDIFRLSNVPMAIADKEGALVDVNDAMRGFGRIDQDTVKTLTVDSLVAPESSKALEDAMSEMLAASSVPQENPGPPQGGSQPFLANAGIGDRPTVLTVSLVYDERGEASAFHVALIPMAQKLEGKSSADCGRSSTEYNGEAPGLCVDEALRGNGGKDGASAATCASATGKRSVRVWDSRERTTSQKRPATIKQQQSFSS